MAFKTIPVNVTGPSYRDRARGLASQETRNFYPEIVEEGKDQFVIKSFPGQKLLGSAVAGSDRGQHQMLEVAFRVIGNTLYTVDVFGVHTALGTIPGTERCIMDDDGVNLFIVADSIVSQYDGSTVTAVTDTNIVGAQSVAFINNQFAYTKPLLTVFSNVGDGSTASGLNAIGAEAKPDELVRDYPFDQVLYRFGVRSIESWYNSGVGKPPFDKIEGQFMSIGCSAKHSITNTVDFLYWLGSDKQIYRARGGQETAVSSGAVSADIQSYSDVSGCFSESFVIDDKYYVMFTFPSNNKTWVLIESLGVKGWFELSEGIGEGRYNAGSILGVYGKTLVGDRSSGELYELDFDTYTQSGEPWQRRRVLATINGDTVGQKGKRIQMSRFELQLEKGVSLLTGQGEDAKIMIEYSLDGGRSWQQGDWMRVGRLGEFTLRAEWYNLTVFYEMIIRMTTTDPVAYNIFSGSIDLRLAGR